MMVLSFKIALSRVKESKGMTDIDEYCSVVDDEVSQVEVRSYLFSDIACAIGALGALFLLTLFIGFLVNFSFENPRIFLFFLGVVGFFLLLRWVKGGIDRCGVEIYHLEN